MIFKSEVHDENINDFSVHPLTCTKRHHCKWQNGSNPSGEHNTLLCWRWHIYKVIIYVCDWALKHFIKRDLVEIFKCQLMTSHVLVNFIIWYNVKNVKWSFQVCPYFKFLPKSDVKCTAVNYTGDTVKFSFSTQYISSTFHILFSSVCIKRHNKASINLIPFLSANQLKKFHNTLMFFQHYHR